MPPPYSATFPILKPHLLNLPNPIPPPPPPLPYPSSSHRLNLIPRNHPLLAADHTTSDSKSQIQPIIETETPKSRARILTEFNDLVAGGDPDLDPNLAFKLLSFIADHGVSPDSRTFTTILRRFCKKNELGQAKMILDHMVENGLELNVADMTDLIHRFCKKGKLQKAMEVYNSMGRAKCEPTIVTINCLMKCLCYIGRVEEASEMLSGLKKKTRLKPDIYTYTAVMDGLCKVGRSDEAMELLGEAMEMELRPNVVTFNTLFTGYCKEGRPLEGFGVLELMKERKCLPDHISYSTLLHGLVKWRKFRAAGRVYREMVEAGFEADGKMMNKLLKGLCRKSGREKRLLEVTRQVFEKMKNGGSASLIKEGTYCLVIQTLCIRNEIEEAFDQLREMVERGYGPRMVTFKLVIEVFCAEGKVEGAMRVLVLMNECGRGYCGDSYDLLIGEFNRQGLLLRACNVYGAALKLGVVPHQKPQF